MATKIAFCASYGGFGLSKKCKQRMKYLGYKGPYDSWRIKRHDPILIQAIEDIGLQQASGECCKLAIAVISGHRYKIDEYDGCETVIEPKDIQWISTVD